MTLEHHQHAAGGGCAVWGEAQARSEVERVWVWEEVLGVRTSGDHTAHWECTQALLMADTRTSSSGPRPSLGGVPSRAARRRTRCIGTRLVSQLASCVLWHSAQLRAVHSGGFTDGFLQGTAVNPRCPQVHIPLMLLLGVTSSLCGSPWDCCSRASSCRPAGGCLNPRSTGTGASHSHARLLPRTCLAYIYLTRSACSQPEGHGAFTAVSANTAGA